MIRIAPISPWHAADTVPVAAWITTRIIPRPAPMIAVTIVSRTRISVVIREWIPAVGVPVAITKREIELEKGYERGTPPSAIALKLATRTPRPVTVVIDPATIVIWRPAPFFIAHPGPAIRRAPDPMAITIRRPIAVS